MCISNKGLLQKNPKTKKDVDCFDLECVTCINAENHFCILFFSFVTVECPFNGSDQ